MADQARVQPLKLRVRDAEDLTVASAMLQDALIPVQDMRYLQREKRFALIANRFCWERTPEPLSSDSGEEGGDASFETFEAGAVYERVNCGVTFDQVRRVRLRGFALRDRARILELLAITHQGQCVTLTFAGGSAVELTVTRLNCHLKDLGEAWPTLRRPEHRDPESPQEVDKASPHPGSNPDLES